MRVGAYYQWRGTKYGDRHLLKYILFRHITCIALLLVAALIVFAMAFGRDYGASTFGDMPVSDLVLDRLVTTLKLLPLWILFAAAIAIPLGFLAAAYRGTWIDRVAEGVAAFGVAAPYFCLGLALFIVFVALFGRIPLSYQQGFPVGYILPAFALGLLTGAAMIRLIRSSLLEIASGKDIKLARIKRCLRNTLISVPVLFGGFLAGIVVIEPVLGPSGFGELTLNAMRTRDFPLIQAIILLTGAMVLGFKLAVHILVLSVDILAHRLEGRAAAGTDTNNPIAPREVDQENCSVDTSSSMPRWRLPWVALIALSILTLAAISAPVIAPYDPQTGSLEERLTPPGDKFLLGTDKVGRDTLSRLIHGARTGLTVALISLLPVSLVGGTLGVVSAVSGGKVDTLIMWAVDAALAFPNIVFALLLASALGPGWLSVVLAVTVMLWPKFARVTRDELMSVKAHGGFHKPDLFNALVVLLTFHVGLAILMEATLSFFGMGLSRPTPSWGLMVADGREVITTGWWVFAFSGLAISVVPIGLIASSFRWSKI